jgi:hypothetical protein
MTSALGHYLNVEPVISAIEQNMQNHQILSESLMLNSHAVGRKRLKSR